MEQDQRQRPNILITGTPGTGKTTLASLMGEEEGFLHVDVPAIIQENRCYEGRDDALDSHILDEDKLLDLLESRLAEEHEKDDPEKNSIVMDYHLCEIFPERWFDLVIVLRTQTEPLFDRLTQRGYSAHKRQENMDCEIMQVVLDAARESYATEIVHECPSNSIQDLESAAQRIKDWTKQWMADRNSDD